MALASVINPQILHHGQFSPALAQEAYVGELSDLRLQASWLSHLVDTMPAGVVVLDGQGMIAKANQIASDMLGEPLEGEKWFAVIQRSFRPQQDDGHEVSLRDGRRIKLEIRALTPEPGQLILMTDLTETRRLQSRVAHMQRLSALGKMVATLAHQVRTPLSAAMLYGANLGSSRLNNQSRAHCHDKLMSRLKDLENQVNDMLLFAKSGEQQVVEPMSLGLLLNDVNSGSEAMLSEHEAHLQVQLPEPDIEVMGNRTALASAINNLVHNSLQVIGSGAHIKMQARRQRTNSDYVDIIISDNGPGINEEIIDKIFEPFFTTKRQGTGLGLAVVASVVNAHKGQIKVENLQNGGAQFTLTLPVLHSNTQEQSNE
ncbi:Sensor protein FixL [Pseudoalteromonas sp. THAF3]|uniref:sensor histidine kinase n=1 Tax=Pseudoalteromonas sp. THAF3 TaxID=2587843 RepID=UPI0012686FDB|nr:ATP-binding protein [Pseudoalteromonas sp. THAF3]QFU05529.1 Sensor protein FixL [Pseudoalteromonas sp. THAF3]